MINIDYNTFIEYLTGKSSHKRYAFFIGSDLNEKTNEVFMGYIAKFCEKTDSNILVNSYFSKYSEEAFYKYTDVNPVVCSKDSISIFLSFPTDKPTIINLNTDLNSDILSHNWANTLDSILANYTPVLIGVSSEDRALKNYFKEYYETDIYFVGVLDDLAKMLNKEYLKFLKVEDYSIFVKKLCKDILGIDSLSMNSSRVEFYWKNEYEKIEEYNSDFVKANEEISELVDSFFDDEDVKKAFLEESDIRRAALILELSAEKFDNDFEVIFNYARFLHFSLGDLDKAKIYYDKALKIDESSYVYENYALLMYDYGDFDEANKFFNKSVELFDSDEDKNPYLLIRYAIFLREYGDFDKSMDMFLRYKEFGDLNNYFYYEYALLLNDFKEYEKAIDCLKKAIEEDDTNYLYFGEIAKSYALINDFRNAKENYLKAINLSPDNISLLYNYGIFLVNFGFYDESTDYFKRIIDINPNFYMAYNEYALALEKLERYDEAESVYKMAIGKNPDFKNIYNNYGILLEKTGREDEAEKFYKKIISDFPDYPHAYYNYALLCQKRGDLNKAEEFYKKAIENDGSYVMAYMNLALLLTDLNKFEESIYYYEKILEMDDTNIFAFNNLALLYEHLDDSDKALNFYKEGMKKLSFFDNIHVNYLFFLQKFFPKKVDKEFKKFIKKFPDSAKLFYEYAKYLENVGDLDGVEEFYEKALEIEVFPDLIINYAIFLEKSNNFEKAELVYDKGIESFPNNAFIYYNYGVMLDIINDHDRSKKLVKKALRIDNTNPTFNYFYAKILFFQENNYKLAKKYLDKSLKVDPYNYYANVYYAMVLKALKSYNKSKIYFEKAIDIMPDSYYAYYQYALAKWQNNEVIRDIMDLFDKAVDIGYNYYVFYDYLYFLAQNLQFNRFEEIKDEALEIEGDSNPEFFTHLGYLYFYFIRDYDKSKIFYEKAIDMKYSFDFSEYADVLRNLGRFDEADKFYKKAFSAGFLSLNFYINYGVNFLNLKKYDEALEMFFNAADYDKEYEGSDLFVNIAFTYDLMGDYDKANEFYIKAEKVSKDNVYFSGNYAGFLFKRGLNYDKALKLLNSSISNNSFDDIQLLECFIYMLIYTDDFAKALKKLDFFYDKGIRTTTDFSSHLRKAIDMNHDRLDLIKSYLDKLCI